MQLQDRMDVLSDGRRSRTRTVTGRLIAALGVFGVIWSKVPLFVCLSAMIDAPMGNFQLGLFGVIWSEVLLFVCLNSVVIIAMLTLEI